MASAINGANCAVNLSKDAYRIRLVLAVVRVIFNKMLNSFNTLSPSLCVTKKISYIHSTLRLKH